MPDKLNIVVVGLGLIGGSIAKALKMNTGHKIYAFDTNEASMLDAVSSGVISGRASAAEIKDADIIYLCTYPDGAVDFVKKNMAGFKPSVIVVDSCGIKEFICSEIEKLQAERDFIFVGAHPMAGKEKNGFCESTASLFLGASYIITPEKAPEEAVKTVESLALSMGFGRIVKTTPENHDRIISFTSQLPHVLACAYVMSPSCKEHEGFSAGSYRDVSRVADINAELWTKLFIENKDHLVTELDILIDNINSIKNAVAAENTEALQELLQKAGDTKRKDNKR